MISAIATVGAAAIATAAPATAGLAEPDPIYAAIETHKAATAAHLAAIEEMNHLEEIHVGSYRKSLREKVPSSRFDCRSPE